MQSSCSHHVVLRFTKVTRFSKVYYCTPFHYYGLSGASPSHIRASAMLLLLPSGNYKLRAWFVI